MDDGHRLFNSLTPLLLPTYVDWSDLLSILFHYCVGHMVLSLPQQV